MTNPTACVAACLIAAGLDVVGCQPCTPQEVTMASSVSVTPASMARVGVVDDRYLSYNVEMLEVTGGKFWKPYGPELDAILKQPAPSAASNAAGDTPAGMNPALYQYLPPLDLTNRRLRKLATALGPAYVRTSGTWANTTYFPDSDTAPKAPPAGFNGVLTRQQWKSLVDFANAVDAGIVTSFATSVGTRDARGVWTTAQARRLLDYTASVGGRIAAAEYMNEPTLAAMGGAPAGYDAAAYGRDFKVFRAFVKQAAPDMLILGPGSVGETAGDGGVAYGIPGVLNTADLLAASGPGVDAFSYHHYGASSIRCAAVGPQTQTTADAALSEQWLAKTDETLAFYRPLRDKFEPGKPFWNTETADAACGGNPWGGTFLDTFRYLDQLGRLAKQDVRVVAHNTLVASDYGLLEEKTFTPKPNYWASLAVAQTHGHHGARIGRADSGGSACLCAVPARHSRRCGAAGDQHGQIHATGAHDPTRVRALHPVCGRTRQQEGGVERRAARARGKRRIATPDRRSGGGRNRHSCACHCHVHRHSAGRQQRLSIMKVVFTAYSPGQHCLKWDSPASS